MKFTFLIFVILFFRDPCVSADLEIYPDVQQENDYNKFLEYNKDPYGRQMYIHPRWLGSVPLEDGVNEYMYKTRVVTDKIHERMRQLEEFVNRRKQMREEAEKNQYLDVPEIENQNYNTYHLKYPNQQILDDVRPYPRDEADFSFQNGEIEEEEEEEEDDGKVYEENVNKEASGIGALNQEKTDEFAFAPPDPRFYVGLENIQKNDGGLVEDIDNPVIPLITQKNFHVRSRNEKFFTNLGKSKENTVEVVAVRPQELNEIESAGVYIIAIVAGISAAATVGLIAFAIGWYNLQKHVKNASDVEYPAYGVTGPNKEVSPSGDRRLAQSAQMYHYQHQKQQIIAMESSRNANNERHGSISEADSDEENEEGDYTVYECPGLAPTGEMEVKNPLFQDDPTPAQTPQVKQNDSMVQKK